VSPYPLRRYYRKGWQLFSARFARETGAPGNTCVEERGRKLTEDEVRDGIISILSPSQNHTYYTLREYFSSRNGSSRGFTGALTKLIAEGVIVTSTVNRSIRYELAGAAEYRKAHGITEKKKNSASWNHY
jgi:hypothetical protein